MRARRDSTAREIEVPAGWRPGRCMPRHQALRVDSAAMETDIHLDQDVDETTSRREARRPFAGDRRVVDDEGQFRALDERQHAIDVDRVERIGDADVLQPGGGKISASPSFAQVIPRAPRVSCCLAMATLL